MRTPVDDVLRREALTFELRFGCEHCAHFEPLERRCGDGYPNAPHRGVSLEAAEAIEFCKSFELV